MRIGTFTRQLARIRWSARRLAYDKRGNAAIEFAMLAPLLTLTLLGTIEMSRAINMDREFNQATDMTGDLVAREQFLGTSQNDALTNLNAMVASVQEVMQPYDTASLALGIFSVQASPTNANDTRVVWSYSYNGKSVPSKCQSYTLPAGLVPAGASVIVVESKAPATAAWTTSRATIAAP